ncbi:type VII secretion integral membrane protein EccD [Nocardia sp. NPDC003963]
MTDPSMRTVSAVRPELCRVSVIGGNTQVDLALPAAVPLAVFIQEVVELIATRDSDPTEPDEDTPLQTEQWTLARLGRDPLSLNHTLTEAGVTDGALLVLRSVTDRESPALFDDVIDAVSRLTRASFRGWSPTAARGMGLLTGLVALLSAIALLLDAKCRGVGIWPGSTTLVAGSAAFVVAAIAARRYTAERTAAALSAYGVVLAGATAVLLVPASPGSAHLLLGGVTVLVTGIGAYRVVGVGAMGTAAAAVLGVSGACAALVHMVWGSQLFQIGAGLLIGALVLISLAPRLAVAAARLPVPPVPSAGEAIDPADHEPRPTVQDIGVVGVTSLPSAVGLESRARTANQFQSGMLLAAAVVAAAGAVLAADPLGAAEWQGIVLSVVAGMIICLRGRVFADLVQTSALVAAGALMLITVALALGFGQQCPIPAGVALLVGSVAMAGMGVVGPSIEVSPVIRRAVEVLEYLLILTVVPLVLWTMDVYSAARNL